MKDNLILRKLFDKEFIFTEVKAKSYEEALSFLSDKLLKKKVVKKGYKEALLQRELEYPTGLPIGKNNIAIPHTYPQYAKKQIIAIAILKEPVLFQSMEDREVSIPVKVVICLVMCKEDSNVKLFSKLLHFFTNEENMDLLWNCKKVDEVWYLLQQLEK